MNTKYVSRKGFTLIELLVVVIIIAILAAIAVPQYKHAVLKSRFSTVMPMAKAIADAQEVYYQGRQLYALDVDELDVTPVNAENTSVSLSQTDGYDYVMAQNSRVPGANYIIYQKYSENYPSEIHCEAEDDNADAQWLCGVLSNNNSIGTTITSGYTTYVINGTGTGFPPAYIALMERVDCTGAEALGFTCTSDAEAGIKKICQNGICRTRTYNEDGSYTSVTCSVNSQGVCVGSLRSVTYDANGNKTSQGDCSFSISSDGTCNQFVSQGSYIWTYDANGNMLSQRGCKSYVASGKCYEYDTNRNYDYTYDENGNMTSQRQCVTVASNGTCSAYSYHDTKGWTYDIDGRQTSERTCASMGSDGTCSLYGWGYDFTYDASGNRLTQRTCNTYASDGTCNAYGTSGFFYTYDENGNQMSKLQCESFASDGTCSKYVSGSLYNHYYTYDANGSQISHRGCETVASDGTCSAYGGTTSVYTYDDNGKQIAEQRCSGSNLNTTTGECIAYSATYTIAN